MDLTIRTRHVSDVTIVDIAGRVVLGQESATLRSLVSELLDNGHKKLVFNLGDVNYIDSSGLGHLISAYTTVRNRGGELKLLNLTKNVHNIMQMTKLYTIFDVTDNEEAAVRSFRQSLAATP
jgi:anti-sigma B factor antagonist